MRFTILLPLLLTPFSLAAPTGTSIAARAPVSESNIIPRQLGQQPDTDGIIDAFTEFIKEVLSQFGLSRPPSPDAPEPEPSSAPGAPAGLAPQPTKRQLGQQPDTDGIIDAFTEFIKEVLSQFGLSQPPAASPSAGPTKRQAEAPAPILDFTKIIDSLSEALKKLFAEVDFNKAAVKKRQAGELPDLKAIIEQLKKLLEKAPAGGAPDLDLDFDFNKLQNRQADAPAPILDFSKIIDSMADMLKTLFKEVDFNKLQKRQGLDISAMVEKLTEALKKLFEEVDFNKLQKRQGLDINSMVEKLSEALKKLFEEIDF